MIMAMPSPAYVQYLRPVDCPIKHMDIRRNGVMYICALGIITDLHPFLSSQGIASTMTHTQLQIKVRVCNKEEYIIM